MSNPAQGRDTGKTISLKYRGCEEKKKRGGRTAPSEGKSYKTCRMRHRVGKKIAQPERKVNKKLKRVSKSKGTGRTRPGKEKVRSIKGVRPKRK